MVPGLGQDDSAALQVFPPCFFSTTFTAVFPVFSMFFPPSFSGPFAGVMEALRQAAGGIEGFLGVGSSTALVLTWLVILLSVYVSLQLFQAIRLEKC